MYNKKGVAEVWGERRKSARISALEEKENEKRKLRAASKGKSVDGGNVQPSAPKRTRKQKRLEDIDLPYLDENQSQQDGEDTNDWNRSTRTDREITGQSSMPERRFLEYALAVLQRRDTHNIFAQPVNPKEVENYDSIVKEPMDFGTMKTKLQEGKYTSLDQFESDVFLICSNAVLFNSSCTIYYKEARAMQILAQAVFSSLRNDPYKFESKFSPVRGRSGRKLPRKSENKRTPVRTPRRTGVKIGASPLGPRDDGEPTLAKRDDPQFYRPWTSFCSENEALVSSIYNAEKTLVIDEKFGARYKQSLIWFARGLGPAAKREAAKKVIKCIPRVPNPSQNTQRLPPVPSFAPRSVSHRAQFPILQNSPGSSNVLLGRNTFLNLNVKASSSVDRNTVQELTNLMPPPKERITQSRNNHQLGIRPMLDNNIAQNTSMSQSVRDNLLGKMPMLGNNITQNTSMSQSFRDNLLGKMPMLQNSITQNTPNFNILGSSSRENRAFPSGYTTTNLQPNTHLTQNFVPQKELRTQNGEFWLASHLKVILVEDKNNPSGKKFVTLDMLAESNNQMGKQETPPRAQSLGSSSVQGTVSCDRWQSLTNSNNCTNSKQIAQPSKGDFNDDVFATLEMLLNHEYTPLPSYDELGFVPDKAGNSAHHYHHHHHGADNVNQEVGPYLKDTDHGPDLSLQL